MEFVYLEVSVKNKQNPLKLELIPTYHEKLKVYCSSVNKFPSKFNSEQVFEVLNKLTIKICLKK